MAYFHKHMLFSLVIFETVHGNLSTICTSTAGCSCCVHVPVSLCAVLRTFSVFFENVFSPQSCVIDNSVLFKVGHTVRAFQNKPLRHWCIYDNHRTVTLWYLILNFNVCFAMTTEQTGGLEHKALPLSGLVRAQKPFEKFTALLEGWWVLGKRKFIKLFLINSLLPPTTSCLISKYELSYYIHQWNV